MKIWRTDVLGSEQQISGQSSSASHAAESQGGGCSPKTYRLCAPISRLQVQGLACYRLT